MTTNNHVIDIISSKINLLLTSHKLLGNLLEHPVVRTMEDVKLVLPNIPPYAMIKALLIKIEEDGKNLPQYVLCGIPANKKLDFARLAVILNVKRHSIKLASAEEIKSVTEYEIGALPPFAMPDQIKILLDKSILQQEYVWCGVGTHQHSLKLSTKKLKSLSNGYFLNLVTEESSNK